MKQKPKYGMWAVLRFMHRCAWESRRIVPFLVIFLALLTVARSVTELFLAPEILARVESGAPLHELLVTIGIFVLALIALAAVGGYANVNAMWPRMNVRLRVMRLCTDKSGEMSYPLTSDPEVLKLRQAAIMTLNNNSSAAENVWVTLEELTRNIVGFVLYLFIMRSLHPLLIAAVLAATVLSFLAARRAQMLNYADRDERNKQNDRAEYITTVANDVTTAKDIRIFGLAPWLKEIREDVIRAIDALAVKREKRLFLANLADALLSMARNGFAYFILINMALAGELSAPEFLLYFTAVSGFTNWVTGIMDKFATLRRECMELSQTMEFINLPEPFRFEGGKAIPERKSAGRELRLEHVSFRYPGAERDTLHDVDLTLRPGEKLAIVGLNGAGKTTLVKLLCGFLDPTEGRILMDGEDIREFDRREYYSLFSAVFQEFSVLDVTVAENVAQSADSVDTERVRECIEKAGLSELVEKLPNGLDTHVGRDVYLDGVQLSGGETQRLMLARALYRDGDVLVLDEPTAALDPIAENDIYMKYNEMTEGKTSVFISHRLASTRFCDRVIFLADGRIAEEGTHDELLRLGGGYAELFEIQSRYYREGSEF